MATSISSLEASVETFAEMHNRPGEVSLSRILWKPPVGMATEADRDEVRATDQRICELVDGVLVEKSMGYDESCLAILLGGILSEFVYTRKLGRVSGPDGAFRLLPGLIRVPDVAFVSRERLPDRSQPGPRVPGLAPDLAVEILRESNTRGEMTRKLRGYFENGTRLVWYFEAESRTVRVYDAPDSESTLTEHDVLDGGTVPPDLRMDLAQLFARWNLEDSPDSPVS